MIKDIKVRTVGEKGPRTIKIDTKVNRIETPTRTLTSFEDNYKSNVDLDKLSNKWDFIYPNEIYEITTQIDQETINNLLEKNGAFQRMIQKFNPLIVKNSQERLILFYPKVTKSTLLNEDAIEIILLLQMRLGLEIVSIPDSKSTFNYTTYIKHVDKARKYLASKEYEGDIIPYIDMETEHSAFKQKINFLISEGYQAIGLTSRSIDFSILNLKYIEKELRDKDVWFHMSGVNRYYKRATSGAHIPQLFGVDTTSTLIQQGGGSATDLSRVKMFEQNNLQYELLAELKEGLGQKSCGCPICKGKDSESFISTYSKTKRMQQSSALLDRYCKIHETFASHEQFAKTKNMINSNEFLDYYNSKKGLKQTGFLDKK